ncbi:MAG: molybdenum cofactor guanylyltransferase [Nitrososphaerales archaeon]
MRAALILAGGLSKRMGRPKQFLDFYGVPLFARISSRLADVVDEVVLSISKGDEPSRYRPHLPDFVLIVKDELDVQAPLVGFCSGLKPIKSNYTFIVSCDAPFVNPKVVCELFNRAEGGDAALPRWPNGLVEPLHAVYHTSRALDAACRCVKANRFKNLTILDYMQDVRYIDVEELRRLDQNLLTFFNVNTFEDYKNALKAAAQANSLQ